MQLVDDRGAPTIYRYDTLDRQTKLIFQDGSTRTSVYDPAGDVIDYTDENGSVFTNTFDALGRKTAASITRASGVIGTTAQSFQYDGLNRLMFAPDTAASNADVNRYYDSLSRVIEEAQTFDEHTRTVTYHAFKSFPPIGFTFPNDRQITSVYAVLYRRTLVEETSGGADLAAWKFFGPARIAELVLGNGLIMTHMNNARTRSARQSGQSTPDWGNDSSDRLGYDGAGRIITKRYLAGGINGGTHVYSNTSAVVGFTTSYDFASNKFYERHLHAESRSHLYEPYANNFPQGGYDSANRLRQYQRGTLSSTIGYAKQGGGSVTTPIAVPNTNISAQYDLDGLNNWRRYTTHPVGGSAGTEIRQHNYLNQITRTDDGTQTDFEYDGQPGESNGNLQNDGVRTYEWDALNRLVKVYKAPSSPTLIAEYTYDALNRRIRKTISNGGLSGTIPNGTTDDIYNPNWQCVEERNGSNSPTKQYIWGIYIDELLQLKTLVTINGNAAGNYYPLSDLMYRTVALTNSSGTIIEAYDCDVYGNTLIFTAAGTGSNWWANDAPQGAYPTCETIFTGRQYDPETRLYYFRRREYDPVTGRFIGRDPIGYRDGMGIYVAWFVPKGVDPLGLEKHIPCADGSVHTVRDNTPSEFWCAGRGGPASINPKVPPEELVPFQPQTPQPKSPPPPSRSVPPSTESTPPGSGVLCSSLGVICGKQYVCGADCHVSYGLPATLFLVELTKPCGIFVCHFSCDEFAAMAGLTGAYIPNIGPSA